MEKILWVDTETSGLKPYQNGIISLAGFYIDENDNMDSFSFVAAPHENDVIESKALAVNGYTMQDLDTFPDASVVINEFETWMKQYINPFDSKDKFIMAGYNIAFDMRFLHAWFNKHGNNFFFSYFYKQTLDVLKLVRQSNLGLKNNKLETVAKYFDFDGNFHQAMDDIKATYHIYRCLGEL